MHENDIGTDNNTKTILAPNPPTRGTAYVFRYARGDISMPNSSTASTMTTDMS